MTMLLMTGLVTSIGIKELIFDTVLKAFTDMRLFLQMLRKDRGYLGIFSCYFSRVYREHYRGRRQRKSRSGS